MIARLAAGLAASALLLAGPLRAQPQAPPAPLVSPVPVPGELELARLVWTTIMAVDHANEAGNYSVLRDLGAPGFQAANDAARLAQIFAGIRQSEVDLSHALLVDPVYAAPPAMTAPDMLRVRGSFPLRPTALLFDLSFQWVAGEWRIFGISLASRGLSPDPPAAAQPPPRPASR